MEMIHQRGPYGAQSWTQVTEYGAFTTSAASIPTTNTNSVPVGNACLWGENINGAPMPAVNQGYPAVSFAPNVPYRPHIVQIVPGFVPVLAEMNQQIWTNLNPCVVSNQALVVLDPGITMNSCQDFTFMVQNADVQQDLHESPVHNMSTALEPNSQPEAFHGPSGPPSHSSAQPVLPVLSRGSKHIVHQNVAAQENLDFDEENLFSERNVTENEENDYPLTPHVLLQQVSTEREREWCWFEISHLGEIARSCYPRLSRKEKDEITSLRKASKEIFKLIDGGRDNVPILVQFVSLVKVAFEIIENESWNRSRADNITNLSYRFRQWTFPFLGRSDFDVQQAVDYDEFSDVTGIRQLIIKTALYKIMQLFRFEGFQCILGNFAHQPECRGKTVIRVRLKTRNSFRKELFIFLQFLLEGISEDILIVDNMYICENHKQSGILKGLLLYLLCPTAKDAENVLRALVRFCEHANDDEKRDIYKKMFRKQGTLQRDSTAAGKEKLLRVTMCEKYTAEDFEVVKELFHFEIADGKEDVHEGAQAVANVPNGTFFSPDVHDVAEATNTTLAPPKNQPLQYSSRSNSVEPALNSVGL